MPSATIPRNKHMSLDTCQRRHFTDPLLYFYVVRRVDLDLDRSRHPNGGESSALFRLVDPNQYLLCNFRSNKRFCVSPPPFPPPPACHTPRTSQSKTSPHNMSHPSPLYHYVQPLPHRHATPTAGAVFAVSMWCQVPLPLAGGKGVWHHSAHDCAKSIYGLST